VYEGLIDEFFELTGNFLRIEKRVLGKETKDPEETTLM
jgi:hypothetical protein